MSISKHSNYKYDSNIPYFVGDRRYGQDMIRDFYSILSHIGEGIKGLTGQDNFLLTGGVVTKDTWTTIDISELTGTVLSSVEIPDSFGSIPPSKTTADIIMPVNISAQSAVSLSGATLDGTTINYVKVSYTVVDGNTRTRAKKAGTYAYEVQPSVTITITSVAPTSYELEIATLVGNGTSTLVISPTKYGYLREIDAVKLNAQNKTGIIIPLYVYPASVFTNTTYNAVIDFAKENRDIPIIVIVNPSSGAGTVTDGNYTYAIRRLQGANIKVIGYVSTNYTITAIATVKADVDKWGQLYPDIDGIFFDEMTYADVPAEVAYYKELNEYVKMNGMEITVTNPGVIFGGTYQEANVADIIIGWENSTYPSLAQAQGDFAGGAIDYPLNKRGVLIHSEATYVPAEALQLAKYFGWIYITDDNLSPNPWDALSTYLEEMSQTIDEAVGTYAQDQDIRTTDAVTHTGGVKTDTDFIKTKYMEIGNFDMDTNASKSIAHGLTIANVRTVEVYIRPDGSDSKYPIHHQQGGDAYIDATNVIITRALAGFFDSTSFDDGVQNRGYIKIDYIP